MQIEAIVTANSRFGFNLLDQLAKERPEENVFISPISVSVALAMLCNGARGRTQAALGRTLELDWMGLDEINKATATLIDTLQTTDDQVRLAIANGLWAADGIPFKAEFVRRLQDMYTAKIAQVDFSDPATLPSINGWVRDQTEGKIKQILSRLDPLALLVLGNAIYFKGDWKNLFDEENTRDGPFTLLDGSRKILPMMAQSGRYRYLRGSGFQAIRLPYGRGKAALYIFLPDRGSSLDRFTERLKVERWGKWMSRFHPVDGSIVLPRFKLEYLATLNESLAALGMGVAFRPEADFRAMCDAPSSVSKVVHKTFVEVNEAGTEAAAATAVVMVKSMMVPQETFRMVVDRPFFCAIRDDQTGALLFTGFVVEPE